jgi:Transposase
VSTTPTRGKRRREVYMVSKRKVPLPPQLQRVNLNAAGIDIGSEEHWAAVPPGRDFEGRDVRSFGAFTGDLSALADWLKQCGIETVAMESTGVYWIALYELLVERGFEVQLVDARQAKNVPGRKSDVLDCQWLQELHTPTDCYAVRFAPSIRSASYAATCVNVRCWSSMLPITSSTCKSR